jgi:hypothetical protein
VEVYVTFNAPATLVTASGGNQTQIPDDQTVRSVPTKLSYNANKQVEIQEGRFLDINLYELWQSHGNGRQNYDVIGCGAV